VRDDPDEEQVAWKPLGSPAFIKIGDDDVMASGHWGPSLRHSEVRGLDVVEADGAFSEGTYARALAEMHKSAWMPKQGLAGNVFLDQALDVPFPKWAVEHNGGFALEEAQQDAKPNWLTTKEAVLGEMVYAML
jgi:hypothetical protein